MFGFLTAKTKPHKIFKQLKEFESFCMGETYLSPDHFRKLNEELSLNAVMTIGKHKFQHKSDGKHLIWTDPNYEVHDLGPVGNMKIMRECPGFHRHRSLALGHSQVKTCDVMESKKSQPITVVRMIDGTVGFGTNYKIALRNAALKMHLKGALLGSNPSTSWRRVYGHA